jgi:CMP-N,N'-diacetyllegionaminic acid synthase
MRILAIIPARSGSKRLPGKNIKLLDNKPLLVWSIDSAKNISEICDILVSTDDQYIATIATMAGALAPWLRPKNLATDTSKSVDVVLHALNWYESVYGTVDGVLLLQPTSPFRSRDKIMEGVKLYKQYQKSVIAVSKLKINLDNCFYIENIQKNSLKMIPTGLEKNKEVIYAVNGSLYLISPEELRKTSAFYCEESIPLIINSQREAIDIDDEIDWWLAEKMTVQKH